MNTYKDENTGGSKVTKYKPIKFKEKYDFLVRVYGSSLEDMKMIIRPSEEVQYSFKNFLEILFEVIKSQKKQLDYSGYYISFLLEQISEKEFEKISKKYATEKKNIPLDLLKEKVYVIQNLIGHDVTTKDMAYYFQCEETEVIKALNLLNA